MTKTLQNSLCLASRTNEVWNAPKRPKRKFGKCVKVEHDRIDEVVDASLSTMTEFILAQVG